jgi:hypothetical protein
VTSSFPARASGLPQKAGFPQEKICEVHGSWFDPSNPVVKYSGSLKSHECEWMEGEAAAADLVLVLGTSLGGLNADQVATECAERASRGESLGSCIINLQQTEQDGLMTLNFKGKSDDVFGLLLAELGVSLADALPRSQAAAKPTAALPTLASWPDVTCALVPYDAQGRRLPPDSQAPRMWLDLRPGAKIKLSAEHNHQGARQPNSIHIGAKKGQKFQGKPIENAGPGHGAVVKRDEASCSFKLNVEGTPMRLGLWWLEAASRGGPAMLPVVNRSPVLENAEADAAALKALTEASLCSGAAASRRSSSPRPSKAKPEAANPRAATKKAGKRSSPASRTCPAVD